MSTQSNYPIKISNCLDGTDLKEYICNTMDSDTSPVRQLLGENLCTYFLLPLLKLNYLRFGGFSNLLYTQVHRNGLFITVTVLSKEDCDVKVKQHPFFRKCYEDSGTYKMVFRVPAEYLKDVLTFINGRYSRMSDIAKLMIRTYSGLPYKVKDTDSTCVYTDGLLLALNRSRTILDCWIEDLYDPGETVAITEEDELLDYPKDSWIINEIGEQ